MMSIIRLIRFQNLLIILLTQGLIFFGLFKPFFIQHDISAPFSLIDFLSLFTFTALIAAAGYVINDLVDTKADLINKPEKLIIGKSVSIKSGMVLYFIFLIMGLIAGMIMDLKYHSTLYSIIHPVISFGLAFYSLKLKKMPLAGNVMIAVYSAMVPAIMLLFFQSSLKELSAQVNGMDKKLMIFVVLAYIFFAFLSSLIREIIKDMEDMEGDALSGINSTAVALGIDRSKQIALILSMILGISLIICIWLSFSYTQWVIFLLPLVLLLLLTYIFIHINRATTKPDFTRLSAVLKYFMLVGLICLLILSFIQFG